MVFIHNLNLYVSVFNRKMSWYNILRSASVCTGNDRLNRVKRIWYLSPMRVGKVQASLRIRAVSPEPPLLAHISSESRGTFRQKARSLALLNGWTCAVKICHDWMLEDTNSLDAPRLCAELFKESFDTVSSFLLKLYNRLFSNGRGSGWGGGGAGGGCPANQ